MTVRPFVLVLTTLGLLACGSTTVDIPSNGSSSGSGSAVSTTGSAGGGTSGTEAQATSTGTGGNGGGGSGGDPNAWRSALYPLSWLPGFANPDGHRLQDYSYAGYHRGELDPGTSIVATTFEVTSFGADPSGTADSTSAIQATVNAAKANGGGIVHFAEGTYRLDGAVLITSSNVVLRGEGATQSRLAFTKSAGMSYQSHLVFAGTPAYSDERALAADAEAFATTLSVADAAGYSVGDDVVIGWTITPEFIAEHQMSGTWDHPTNAFAGKWQPFFRREVVAIDTSTTPHSITVDVPMRYPVRLRDQASFRRQTGALRECGVESLGLANAVGWDAAWNENQVHVLEFRGVQDSWIRLVESFSPPGAPSSGKGQGAHLQSGGILITDSKRVTVSDSTMQKAEHRGGGGNGYLFEVRQSNEILFRDLVAREGRHNFIQNWGFGVTGCVWQRVHSSGGVAWINKGIAGLTGYSEFHHSLALGNLIDASTFDDGWSIVNRGSESSYSGHTGTQNVMWNTSGEGLLRSRQFGQGFVVGTTGLDVQTSLDGIVLGGAGTAPEDYTEGLGNGSHLVPPSLYDDQLARRLAK